MTDAMITLTGPDHRVAFRASTFGDVLRSEWTKLRSVRSTFWALTVTVVLGVGLGAVISAATAHGYARFSVSGRLSWDPTGVSLAGVAIASLAIAVLGVLCISSEYSSGMIRTSLIAVPKRGRVLAAKSLVFAVVTFVVGEVVSFAAFFVGQALISGHAPHAALGIANISREIGTPVVRRPAYPAARSTFEYAEPAARIGIARQVELAARYETRQYIKHAREAGLGWREIGAALGITGGGDGVAESIAEAAFEYSAGTGGWNYDASFTWTCPACGKTIHDRGPYDGPRVSRGWPDCMLASVVVVLCVIPVLLRGRKRPFRVRHPGSQNSAGMPPNSCATASRRAWMSGGR